MQSNIRASSIASVLVGHWRRRLMVRMCCTSTPSLRKSPPCTTKTRLETTVARGKISKSCWNIMKMVASYLRLHSSKKPPPCSKARLFISRFSWFPLLIITLSGYSSLYRSEIIRISDASSPLSATSPFRRYPVVGLGSPFCLSTHKKSAS